ncbi:MAG: hypothetical protein HND56_07220 [Pseudomonadota bacterium]|mgnify:CR=1 FL=1|jgi:hypothetical protein|nr:hypothetical protein [Pseudomonadota bacterium]QKK05485.1 MAG: hypothetical protein HND56_07220 [Pseudomonadota bacterium]|tara:strand:- start:210 stop:434 length:225 start_codon:yes stop_codon:yes gene_type:complete
MATTTYSDLAVKLLRDAAGFFRNVGEQNEPLKEQMNDNADVYEQVADLLEQDPSGTLELEEDDEDEDAAGVSEA